MKIELPKSDMPLIRLEIMHPEGSFQMTLGEPHVEASFDIPDDVPEDAVEVIAMWLDAGNKPVGDVMVLKEAGPTDEPEEEDNEEAPVEADEDAPNEVADEEVDELPEKEVEVRELPEPSEFDADEWKEETCGPDIRLDDRDDGRYDLGCN